MRDAQLIRIGIRINAQIPSERQWLDPLIAFRNGAALAQSQITRLRQVHSRPHRLRQTLVTTIQDDEISVLGDRGQDIGYAIGVSPEPIFSRVI